MLAFVARRLESEPIVLIAAVRDGVRVAAAERGCRRCRSSGCPRSAAAGLLDAVAPGLDPAVRPRLLDEAAGNPLALTELPGTRRSGSLLKATCCR